MNILFLSHRIPFPPDKGDKIRSFNEIKYLSKQHSIYLATTLDEKSDAAYLSNLEVYCEEICAPHFDKRLNILRNFFKRLPFSVSNFYDKSLQQYVNTCLRDKNIEAVICFCSSMAQYIFENPMYKMNGLEGIKLLMDYVDLDSDKWLQYASYSKFPFNLIYRVENKILFKYEIKINQEFHQSIFVSTREFKVFKKLHSQVSNIQVIPNGVDYEYFSPKKSEKFKKFDKQKGPILIFTGVMDYFANEDGVRWFCKEIFPKIRDEFPHAQFNIVGNRPTNIVWNLSEIDYVTITGYVADIREFYWMADVCVIPLRIARGLQNKVIEAMATGNAVVATSNASDGIICHNKKDIIIADDEEQFANEVIHLLKNENRRKELGQNAVENVIRHYDWRENLQALDALLESS